MGDEKLNAKERQELLDIARKTILGNIKKGKVDEEPAPTEARSGFVPADAPDVSSSGTEPDAETAGGLGRPSGAFVSLHKLGQLRGCIGTFTSPRPLVNTVQEMAISSSQRDPRFPPVQDEEMQDIDIEISVLSPLREIQDVGEIEVGRHGIYITKGFYSGVLLPQVATEYGWNRETFLEHTCMKAGLPPETWKEAGVKIEIFEAQVFGEKK
jgi:AmmeMemoRadiSam system protein A